MITSKNTLHKNLDEMIEMLDTKPREIDMCNSYIPLDDKMHQDREYKGIPITYFDIQGKIKLR
tara:strand:- start:124 stop:312 length:189 start_codon:yes stop_codon:yes gene_type:complete